MNKCVKSSSQYAAATSCRLPTRPHVQVWLSWSERGTVKRQENGRNVTSFRAWPLWPATWVGCELGGSALQQCRWAGCCLFAALSWLCVGCSGFGRFFHWPLISSWTVNLIIFGLGFLRARLLQLCCTAVFPGFGRFFIDFSFLREQSTWSFSGLDSCVLAYFSFVAPLFSLQSFYNYARGHCEAAQASNCSGVCWEEGWGVEGY